MRVLKLILAVLFIAVPLTAFAAEKKANSIDDLAKMYDVSSCKTCHAKIFEEWEKSYHATSLVGSPRTMATIASAVKDGMMKEWTKSGIKKIEDIKVEHMMSCLKCHLPQIKDATDAVAQEIAKAAIDGAAGDEAAQAKLKKVGINCLVCHNQKALIHKWTDGEPEANVIYGNKEGAHADAKFKAMKKSPIMKESILCGQCHGLGPNFDLTEPTQCATLYGSYLHAYVPAGGNKTCQECHMDKGHFMPGYRDPDQAKKAVTVEVDSTGYYFLPKAGDSIPTAKVTVKMMNKAGHRIPDG
ncbi:MAG: cytochrome c family protein [Nitrospirae bacterium]|nr:cytochrome c family protein [Nitrospirota bacterium]MCL5978564.1 cytochrome c family protein [Nitrospirota bacterium]